MVHTDNLVVEIESATGTIERTIIITRYEIAKVLRKAGAILLLFFRPGRPDKSWRRGQHSFYTVMNVAAKFEIPNDEERREITLNFIATLVEYSFIQMMTAEMRTYDGLAGINHPELQQLIAEFVYDDERTADQLAQFYERIATNGYHNLPVLKKDLDRWEMDIPFALEEEGMYAN